MPGGGGIAEQEASAVTGPFSPRAGIVKHVSPHTLRHVFITAALDAGVLLRHMQEAASQCHIAIRRSRLPPSPLASSRSAAPLEGLTGPDLAYQERSQLP
jgi:hypothetical protein